MAVGAAVADGTGVTGIIEPVEGTWVGDLEGVLVGDDDGALEGAGALLGAGVGASHVWLS